MKVASQTKETFYRPVSSIWIALLGVGLGFSADASVTVQIVGKTPTQALLSYTATGSCTVEVSENASYQPLVHDVDPALFAGSNLDTRPEALSSGTNHIFLVGKRRTDTAANGINYSRALQTNTTHYYRVTCGSQVTTGTFTTANIPFGSTYTDVLPADPQNPGEYLWPSLSATDRTETIVDPYTGVLAKHMAMQGDMLNDGSSLFLPSNTSGGMNQTCDRNISVNGFYHCLLIGSGGGFPSLYGVNPSTGESRFLGSPYFVAQAYGVGDGYRLCDTQSGAVWDSTDPNVFYCQSLDSNNNLTIVKGTYTGNDQTIAANTATPQPAAPATFSVLTPSPNNTLTQLLQAYDPSFDPTKFGCEAMGVQANYMLIACLRSIQDSYSWLGVLDLGNQLPIGGGGTGRVIAFVKMWEKAGSRWCGNHSFDFISDVPVMSISTQDLKGAYTFGAGPYLVNLTTPMTATTRGALTTINVSSGWDSTWGTLPSGYQAGEPLSANPDHFLMTAQVGDLFYLDGEVVEIVQKLSSTQWVVERGIGSDQPLPVSHSPGASMQAECNSFLQGGRVDGTQVIFFPQYVWWQFLDSPDATNLTYYMENFGTHVISRGNYRVSTEYVARVGSPADVTTWGDLNYTIAINPSPNFAGAIALASGVSFQKHPTMQDNNPNFYIDQLPLIGTNIFTAQDSSASQPLGGDLYQYFDNGLETPHYGGDGLSRKQWGTLATAGSYILHDISGPNSRITSDSQSAYTFCVAYTAGECLSTSAAGDIFFNAPGLDTAHAWCTGGEYATGYKDICIGDLPMIGMSVSQFKLQSDTTGQSIRNIAKLWGGYRVWTGTANSKLLPDGSWAIFFPQPIHPVDYNASWMYAMLLKMPPMPVSDGIDRTTFVRAPLALTPPAGLGVVAAKVYFGYQEQGSPSQYYCSSRREACVAVSPVVTDSNPYLYAQTDSVTPAPCATSCTITIPVLPVHTAYFRVSYVNAAGNEVAAEMGMASEQAVTRVGAASAPPQTPGSVSVTPGTVSLGPSQNTQFTATVAGSANNAVTWSMTPSTGSLSNGLYTAPSTIASAQAVTITATSVADSTQSGTATVQLTPNGTVSISLSPLSASLSASQTRQFSATVAGNTNTAVTWTMNPSVGSLSNGVYLAPSAISAAQTVTITATSAADGSKSASATVQLTPTVNVTVSPVSVTLGPSQTYQFSATVIGSSNGAVTWSMPPALGTLSNGLYTAPSTITTSQAVTITATSAADPTKSGTATVQLTANSISISMSPATTSLNPAQSTLFTATVSGSPNTAVTWSLPSPVGTLSNGMYTAPSVINTPQTVSVTATSQADPTKTTAATIQLMPNVSVSLNPSTSTLTPSQGRQFTATVTGTTNTGVSWAITPAVGTLTNGSYTAPSTINATQLVTITAASVVDPTKSAAATIQLVPNGLSITLSPLKATLTPSQSMQFSPTVTGSGNTAVTWTMNPPVGTLLNGLYTAPSIINAAQIVTVTATSVQDPTQFGTAAVQLLPNTITLSVSPSSASLLATQTMQFAATVTGTSSTGVTWNTPSVGTLVNGLYTAPSSIHSSQSVTITATSVADGSKSASASIHLLPKNLNIRMSPQTATLAPSQSVQFTALVDGTSDGTVVWSNTGSLGVLSGNGVYTAPSVVHAAQSVTITGTLVSPDGPPVATSAVVTVMPNSTVAGPPSVTWAINAATLGGGPISAGEIVALVGTGLGPNDAATFTVDASGMVATTLANAQVLFDGVPAPLLFVQANQVNAVVPYSVTPGTNVQVQVAYQGTLSNALPLSVAPYSPGLFTLGGGQGAIVNQDGTVNSASNPAPRGSWVSLYGTGSGQTNPPGVDGQVVGVPSPASLLPISVQIGNVDSQVLYSGSATGMVSGVLLINVVIPATAPTGGAVPIIFGIGDSLSQPGVTIAVQ